MLHLLLSILLCSAPVLCDFPPDMQPCSANDPNINDCFKDTTNKLIPMLAKGNLLKGLEPLDPLYVPLFDLPKGNTIIPTLSFSFINHTHLGLKDAQVISADIKPKEYKLRFTLSMPSYEFIGPYKVSGSLVSIPLQGEGEARIKLKNVSVAFTLEGLPVKRDGETFFKADTFTMKYDVEDLTMNLENLFNNKFLSDTTNSLLNLASKAIIKVGLPVADVILRDIYKGFIEQMFHSVPYNQLFADK